LDRSKIETNLNKINENWD